MKFRLKFVIKEYKHYENPELIANFRNKGRHISYKSSIQSK